MPETRGTTDDELIEQYIEFNPRRPGRDRAGLKDSGIEVWALVAYYQGTLQVTSSGWRKTMTSLSKQSGLHRPTMRASAN